MWRKSNFYEFSAQVPLQIVWPGHIPAGCRVDEVVSLVDLTATLVNVADASPVTHLDGDSLLPLMQGSAANWKDFAFSEYLAHGVERPMAMLRSGRYKLNYSLGDPPELYDLRKEPNEFHNLAEDPAHLPILEDLKMRLLSHWDAVDLEQRVRQSQKERLLIETATGGVWRSFCTP